MRTVIVILVLYLSCIIPGSSRASHVIGQHLTYEYTPSGTLFRLTVQSDCGGAFVPNVYICFTSPSGCFPNFTEMLPVNINNAGIEATLNPCNGSGLTSCNGGSIYSFKEYTFEGIVVVPPFSDWIVSAYYCCRNMLLGNVATLNLTTSRVETHFDNLNYPTNSSPQFPVLPMNYYCVGNPSIIDFHAIDPDGDSLGYELVPLLDGFCDAAVTIPFLPGYSSSQPFYVNTPTVLDTLGGQVYFTPAIQQYSGVNILVKEYRNGVLIGSVRKDASIMVIGGQPAVDTLAGRAYYDFNLNNIFDTGDLYANNLVIRAVPYTSYSITSSIGKYDFVVPGGTHTVDVVSSQPYLNIPAGITITTAGLGNFYGNIDFPIQPTPNVNDLTIFMNSFPAPMPGMPYQIHLTYSNVGTTIQNSVTVSATLDPVINVVASMPMPDSISGNTLIWNIPVLDFQEQGDIHIDSYIDSSAQSGYNVLCTSYITSPVIDQTPADNSSIITDIVVATPLDPNRKIVQPEGDLPLSFVTYQDWLYYTINFQNVGNAPAQIVKIFDRIDFDLELGSLELVSSSFPCTMIIQDYNELVIEFFGINLPPASQNISASHGFVTFRIKPLATLQPGALLVNRAEIIFDFNAPIQTNLVYNTIVFTTGYSLTTSEELKLSAFPNPAENMVYVNIETDKPASFNVSLTDILGTVQFCKPFSLMTGDHNIQIPLSSLSSGLYFLTVENEHTRAVIKVVVK